MAFFSGKSFYNQENPMICKNSTTRHEGIEMEYNLCGKFTSHAGSDELESMCLLIFFCFNPRSRMGSDFYMVYVNQAKTLCALWLS
jgi:hypothetical protein